MKGVRLMLFLPSEGRRNAGARLWGRSGGPRWLGVASASSWTARRPQGEPLRTRDLAVLGWCSQDTQDALVGEADGERGVALAMRLGGERALPVDRGMVLLSPGRLCRHLLVCGATGSGKTETRAAVRVDAREVLRRPGVLSGWEGRSGDREPLLRADG